MLSGFRLCVRGMSSVARCAVCVPAAYTYIILEQGFDFLSEGGFGRCANVLVNYLAILDKENGGHVADAKFCSEFVALIYIAFADNGFAFVLVCQFIDDGRNLLAGSAPSSGEVNHEGKTLGLYLSKIAVGQNSCHGGRI